MSTHQWMQRVGFIGFGIYTLGLLALEVATSQAYVRNYFAEITGPVRFYAVNTTLTVFIVWAAALMFAVSLTCLKPGQVKPQLFYLSQILILAYLGFDDRFLIHEWLIPRLGISDALYFIGLGVVEIILLVTLGDLFQQRPKVRRYLYLAALCFGLMVVIDTDALVPPDMVLRLASEDLAKLWAGIFIFMFSWEQCQAHIQALKS